MKGLRVEIVVRREGAPVEEAIAQPVEDVATVLARAGHESGGPRTPSRGPLRRSWAILRPRFSWSGSRPFVAPGWERAARSGQFVPREPRDHVRAGAPRITVPASTFARRPRRTHARLTSPPSPGTPDGSAWQGISCPLAHPSPPFKSPADGLQRICPRRARRPWSRRQLLRGLSRLDDAPAAPSTADHRDSPPPPAVRPPCPRVPGVPRPRSPPDSSPSLQRARRTASSRSPQSPRSPRSSESVRVHPGRCPTLPGARLRRL